MAVCNLASIAVNMFVEPDKTYNFDKLKKVAKVATKNLNKIIDVNYYPVKEARNSNMRHRPIGIGIQVEVLPNVLSDLKVGMELFGNLIAFIFEKDYCWLKKATKSLHYHFLWYMQ